MNRMISQVLLSIVISIAFAFLFNLVNNNNEEEEEEGECPSHSYRIQIINQKPLLIYIENMLKQHEIDHLIELTKSSFKASMVTTGKQGGDFVSNYRTSTSAYINRDQSNVVKCLLKRFAHFQGIDEIERIEPFQIVKYVDNQQSGYHFDWFQDTNALKNGGQRISTFFTYLKSNCSTGGETEFVDIPFKKTIHQHLCHLIVCDKDSHKFGIRFRPISGNSLFWFNLDENGQGNQLTYHAGHPPGFNHFKIGLNTWTRLNRFYWPRDKNKQKD